MIGFLKSLFVKELDEKESEDALISYFGKPGFPDTTFSPELEETEEERIRQVLGPRKDQSTDWGNL